MFRSLCLYRQAAGLSGSKSQRRSSRGKLAWKDFTAVLTPSSVSIFDAILPAAIAASFVRQNLKPSTRFLVSRDLNGTGAGPAPAAFIISPQNG